VVALLRFRTERKLNLSEKTHIHDTKPEMIECYYGMEAVCLIEMLGTLEPNRPVIGFQLYH
jgi:hypothetical protein